MWELLLKVDGSKGVLVDNVKVYERPEDAGAPLFSSDVVLLMDAIEGEIYSQTLNGLATDPDGDLLTYSKVSGPGWVDVSTDGTVSGTPDDC